MTDYRSLPFYSLNDKLDSKIIRKQIRRMHSSGMGGFFLHARGGLLTEYLSDEWFDALQTAITEAEKLGMQAWFYDENGWPSGFADGKLFCEENYVRYLELTQSAEFDKDASCVFVRTEKSFERVFENTEAEIYYNIYIRKNCSYVDILDARITRRFIELTHEVYYRKFKKYFGNVVQGFFTDEPQYFREATPWTNVMPSVYKQRYGKDIFDGLIYLFFETEEAYPFRFLYWKLMNELFVNNYQKQIYDWCEEHGCKVTGHTIEETSLFGQMMCCAGVMNYYEYLHIPGIDWLTRLTYLEISPKQLTSVCAQLGKKQCISEMFGASGHAASPAQLRQIAEFQYVAGVNRMCQHLYPYSVRGSRKRDYPPFFSEESKWNACGREFNNYFSELGEIVGENEELCGVLLISPLSSAYLHYERSCAETLGKLESNFHDVIRMLCARHIPYHIGDEAVMERHGRTEGATLVVGKACYDTIIVPACDNLFNNTHRLLNEFVNNGGKLILCGEYPKYLDGKENPICHQATETLERLFEMAAVWIESDEKADIRTRRMGNYLLVASSTGEEPHTCKVRLKNARTVKLLNLLENRYEKVYAEREEDLLVFEATVPTCGSLLFVLDEGEGSFALPVSKTLDITERFHVHRPEINYLPLDFACLSKDGESYSEPMPLAKIMDRLLAERYLGKIYLKLAFENRSCPKKVCLLAEKDGNTRVYYRGAELAARDTDLFNRHFEMYRLGAVPQEREEIVIEKYFYQSEQVYHALFGEGVTETLKNKLTLDTELETFFLAGEFSVCDCGEGDVSHGYRKIAHPVLSDALPEIGDVTGSLPFLKEEFVISAEIETSGENCVLRISHTFDGVRVAVNEECAGELILRNETDITPYLKRGKNSIELRFLPSAQNAYGPHHFLDPGTLSVTPFHFGYQNFYEGEDPLWVNEYYVKRQGVSKIEILTGEKK